MLTTMLVAAALLSLSVGHWLGGGEASWGGGGGGGGGGWRSRQAGSYCRDNQGYLYRCGDSSWGSGSRWNNYYGNGGYYERARYVGRGRVRYQGRYEGAELICDFRRDGRLGYGERVENVVWKKVRDNYYYGNGGYNGNGGSYGSDSGYYSGCGGSGGGGCGGGRYRSVDRHYPGGYYPSGVVAGWVTTSGDVSTLTLSDPRPYDAGRYRCYAQVRGRNSYGRGDMVYMEVDYRGRDSGWGSGGWGSGGWGSSGWGSSGWGGSGSWGSGGWGSGSGSGGWGGWGYRRSALTKTEKDRVVDKDAATETQAKSAERQEA